MNAGLEPHAGSVNRRKATEKIWKICPFAFYPWSSLCLHTNKNVSHKRLRYHFHVKLCCNSLQIKFISVQCNGPKTWITNFDDVIDQKLTIDKRFKAFIKTKLISYLLPKSSRMKTKGSHFFNYFLYWVNQNPLKTLKIFSGQCDTFLINI